MKHYLPELLNVVFLIFFAGIITLRFFFDFKLFQIFNIAYCYTLQSYCIESDIKRLQKFKQHHRQNAYHGT